jgi:hypothetical protein
MAWTSCLPQANSIQGSKLASVMIVRVLCSGCPRAVPCSLVVVHGTELHTVGKPAQACRYGCGPDWLPQRAPGGVTGGLSQTHRGLFTGGMPSLCSQVRKIRCDKDKDVLKSVARTKVERDDVDMAGAFAGLMVCWIGMCGADTRLACCSCSGASRARPSGDSQAPRHDQSRTRSRKEA